MIPFDKKYHRQLSLNIIQYALYFYWDNSNPSDSDLRGGGVWGGKNGERRDGQKDGKKEVFSLAYINDMAKDNLVQYHSVEWEGICDQSFVSVKVELIPIAPPPLSLLADQGLKY